MEENPIIKKATTILTFTLLILIAGACFYHQPFVSAQTDQATAKLQAANNAINQAFNSVLDAEKAGANVTGLLNQLNDAANLLSNAENAYRTGNFDVATNNADIILLVTQQVTVSSQSNKENALNSAHTMFWTNSALTVIAAIVLVVVLLLLWRRTKHSYIKSIYEAKPEVVTDET